MPKEREIYTINIVLLGNFNPVIITPHWLAMKKIIRETEAETANIEVIHSEITRFSLDWFNYEATKERIDFKTNKESHFSALKDLVVSVFTILKETPLNAFGINHLCHFSFRTPLEYKNFGYWLSPVAQLTEELIDPTLLSIHFIESKSENHNNGIFNTKISPSDLINDGKSVVFITNQHFDSKNESAKEIINLLNENWDNSFLKVNKINDLIWSKAKF